jgi:trans-aconitate 2-methyltransferase
MCNLVFHRLTLGAITTNKNNMKQNDWNPDLYLKFNKERIQPSIDLVARIDYFQPKRIIDIGCGPGNSTQILYNRWSSSEIIGADNSPAMISKATEDYPNQKWILFDAGKESINDKFDIVFSNATIQWIPNHDSLIENLATLLNDSGILAVQFPLFFDMPLGKSISEIAGQHKWRVPTKGVYELFTINNASFYHNELIKHFSKIDIWITDYYHVMESHESILEMIRTTGLKPYLERIVDDNEKLEFTSLILDKIKQDYPLQNDGKVLFPFKRLFFIGKK